MRERLLRDRDRQQDNLTAAEDRLKELIVQNGKLLSRMKESRRTVHEHVSAEERSAVLGVLAKREAARFREQHTYTVKLWQIAFARWINRLIPVTETMHVVSYEGAEERLAVLSQLREVGVLLLQEWGQDAAAKTSEANALIGDIQDAVRGIDAISEELALRQALLADPEATLLNETHSPQPVVTGELEKFRAINAAVARGRYSVAASFLQEEEARLAAFVPAHDGSTVTPQRTAIRKHFTVASIPIS